jgi:hypothetical protein
MPKRQAAKATSDKPVGTAASAGITALTVKGYKSLYDECRIDIRPLTILAGANSSGKSSIMQPLLLMKQTLEAGSDTRPLRIEGPNVRFSRHDQMLSRIHGPQAPAGLSVGVDLGSHASLTSTFSLSAESGLTLGEATWLPEDTPIILREGPLARIIRERSSSWPCWRRDADATGLELARIIRERSCWSSGCRRNAVG